MAKHNGELVRAARDHVFGLFRQAEHAALEYHHFARTRDVVDACKQIARGSELDDEAREAALVCAWFYDACYAKGSEDHRESEQLCTAFLEEQGARRPSAEDVAACFRGADRVDGAASAPAGAVPSGRESPCDIVHDARLAVLASDDYVHHAELLRLELQRRSGRTFSDLEWTEHCIDFLEAHPYRTRFAQLEYGGGRAANLARLQKRLRNHRRQLERARADQSGAANRVGKTAETLYYHFTRIQIGLVGLADRRTNTMIHVNSIMLSIVVALLARRIQTERDLLIPTILLLCVNVTVVFLAVYSMSAGRRTVGLWKLPPEEARVENANLLSVTNEARMSLPQFTDRINGLLADPLEFQRLVVEDLYFGRRVLLERGRALRLTYQVFIYGIALAAIAFVVAFVRR